MTLRLVKPDPLYKSKPLKGRLIVPPHVLFSRLGFRVDSRQNNQDLSLRKLDA